MNSDLAKLCDIRDFRFGDQAFVLATFLRGLYYGDRLPSNSEPKLLVLNWFSMIPKNIFMENYERVAKALINSPNTVVKIACLKEDPDVILGYSILSADFSTIHWVFVKKDWRKNGIAKSLVPQYPTTVTHLSLQGKNLMAKFKDCVFNPFKL